MQTYNSFNEMAGTTGSPEGAGVDFQTLLERTGVSEMSAFNMSPVLIPLEQISGYKFSIGSKEGPKPHVHVNGPGNKNAKFWLDPLSVKDKGNMRVDELNAAMKLIEPNKETFIQQYQKYNFIPQKK